jgi:rhodanese-related sulfurtransferase
LNRKWIRIPAALLAVTIALTLFIACTSGLAIEEMTPRQASDLIADNAGNADFVILDIRTPEEFDAGHIEGAIMVDFRADNFEAEMDKLDRDKAYLLYCRTGNRSRQSLETIDRLGFGEIYHLSDGIAGWQADGQATTR